MLGSCVARQQHFRADWYLRWAPVLGWETPIDLVGKPYLSRKAWEYAAISQVLWERDMLRPGRRGCGFAVGTEPLASAYAARGVTLVATDLAAEDPGSEHWARVNDNARSLEAVHRPELIDRETFGRLVSFQPVDMRAITGLEPGFDFMWSSCALEHLGTLEAGLAFIESAAELLAPGGVAVHTTEFNVASNEATVKQGQNVIYRRRDIEDLDRRLRRVGCGLEAVDFDAGSEPGDIDFDEPPYFTRGRNHIKLLIDGHIATSILLVIRKGREGVRAPAPAPPVPAELPVAEPAPMPPPEPAPARSRFSPRRLLRRLMSAGPE
jgi:SAM-dependent methyltransferase